MNQKYIRLVFFVLLGSCLWLNHAFANKVDSNNGGETMAANSDVATSKSDSNGPIGSGSWSRLEVLAGSLTVFVLAVFVGFEIIAKVPPTLHTPLMSGSNAISGVTVVGAIIATGQAMGGFGSFLGLIAIVLAMINVVGGFYVTHRMLIMFKRK
jgi:H+-translocating NAD(P) transhydrogenase subunit alpha